MLNLTYGIFFVPEVKAKLKSIRTQYTRERKKTKKKKIGSALEDVYVSKFPHYERLQFLDDYVVAKVSLSCHCQGTSPFELLKYLHSSSRKSLALFEGLLLAADCGPCCHSPSCTV